MPVPSLSIDDALLKRIDKDRYNTPRSEWLREAARTQLLIRDIEEQHADLPDDWVERALYHYVESDERRIVEAE